MHLGLYKVFIRSLNYHVLSCLEMSLLLKYKGRELWILSPYIFVKKTNLGIVIECITDVSCGKHLQLL